MTEKEEAIKTEDTTSYQDLIDQVQMEYQIAWDFMKPKIDEWAVRLKLYNNQKRDKEAVGDPLLFTIHQTILASLYDDKLNVTFMGRESGDEETAENLNSLALFDFDEMEKDVLDYEWDWDASFFGRGLVLLNEFNRDKKCPTPEVIDIMTWLRDPRATSVNGDSKGRGAMRFGGREIRLCKSDFEASRGLYFNYNGLKPETSDPKSMLDNNSRARAEAQGFSSNTDKYSKLNTDNASYRCLEWFTHYKGKKVIVTLADNQKRVIRLTELDGDIFPIIDRSLYPISHDWDGVSIPDLVEDKQRARSVVENLGLASIKLGLHPTYLYNSNLIKNRGNLNIDFNRHIPVDGDPSGAIQPVERQTIKQEVNWIMEVLDVASQKATATPDIQQGSTTQDKRTATELNLVSSKVDTRYSLSAKVFGWSEKRFWQQWYRLYKEHFADGIDEKVIRVSGVLGADWRPLTRENIVATVDPDVYVESKTLSDAQKFNQLQKFRMFFQDVMSVDPQNVNVRAALREMGRLSGLKKDEIEQILPPSLDELRAEDENERLSNNEKVIVQVFDDDFVHLGIHNRASDTPAKKAHTNAHRKAMEIKRMQPQFDIANAPKPEPGQMATSMPTQMPMMEQKKPTRLAQPQNNNMNNNAKV